MAIFNKINKLYRGKNVFAKLVEAKITRRRIPVRVSLHVTKYCNLHCSYCYAKPESMKEVKEPTKAELFEVIDEIYSMGTRWIHFLGGEPLLRNDLGELVDYAKGKGIFCEMNTNGMLIKKRIDAVKKIDSLCVSIDGDEQTNDLVRGKGVYAKIIENIEVALNNKLNLRLHCCLTQNTKTTLAHIMGLAKKYNINFNFADYNYRVDIGADVKEVLTKEESDEFYRQYREYKKTCPHISSSFETIDYKLNWPYKDKMMVRECDFKDSDEKPYYRCQIKHRHFFVDADGGVYACGARWKDGFNYKEVGFQKAWEYLGQMDCVACGFINCFEQSAVLDLEPSVVFNAIKRYLI